MSEANIRFATAYCCAPASRCPNCTAAPRRETARRRGLKFLPLGHPADVAGDERRVNQDDQGADRTKKRRHVEMLKGSWTVPIIARGLHLPVKHQAGTFQVALMLYSPRHPLFRMFSRSTAP